MKILIKGGRVIDPASGLDRTCDVAVAAGRIVAVGDVPADFHPNKTIDASQCVVAPGLVDLAVRLREPGHEHAHMLQSEMAAAVAGGVTSLVCPPDTDPVLDEPGLVEMLRFRSEKLHQCRVFPLGALTRGLRGEVLTEMVSLTQAGCIGFGQADVPLPTLQMLSRALQYASTFGYTVWLRPQDRDLGTGVVASGPLATRMGLSGVPVAAETIAIFSIVELMRSSGARVHLCRISSAAGLELVRQAKAEGLPLTCDVSIHSLHLIDTDIGYFDSRSHLKPPLRQQRDRDAIGRALADGTVDALVSDHSPVDEDQKTLPFAESEAGASAVELLLGMALKWAESSGVDLRRALQVLTSAPAAIMAGGNDAAPAGGAGRLVVGGVADLCVYDPQAEWVINADTLRSQGKHTPFSGYALRAKVRCTIVGGYLAFEA
ncbi:MAG: dihydroorotase [Burkholderiaceae bacterium]|nr:dihydroorotase [Rhodoferax sp.]MCP5262864.1 dihydroorotase [Rhodoferax sp.]MCW5628450.1 dihydroorotase [Rhodoferax sp.]MCW5641749.1 dihydroorotase [Rhodoferax sp.]